MKRMQRIVYLYYYVLSNLCSAHHLEHRQRDVLARAFVGVSQGDTKCRGMSCDLYRFDSIAAWVNGSHRHNGQYSPSLAIADLS